MADITTRLRPVVERCVDGLGLDLERLDIRTSGKNRLVRVAVDTDGGVGIDDITRATRAVSAALDDDGSMGEAPYTLEITSRGADQPLTLPRHWRRNHDRLVRVVRTDGDVVEGRIGASDDTGVDLMTKKSQMRLDYADIESAVVQIELNRQKDA